MRRTKDKGDAAQKKGIGVFGQRRWQLTYASAGVKRPAF